MAATDIYDEILEEQFLYMSSPLISDIVKADSDGKWFIDYPVLHGLLRLIKPTTMLTSAESEDHVVNMRPSVIYTPLTPPNTSSLIEYNDIEHIESDDDVRYLTFTSTYDDRGVMTNLTSNGFPETTFMDETIMNNRDGKFIAMPRENIVALDLDNGYAEYAMEYDDERRGYYCHRIYLREK